jgi:hypothetical protein
MRNSVQYIATNSNSNNAVFNTSQQLSILLKSQSGLMLLGCLVVIGIFSWLSDRHKKGKVATSYWGGASQKATARKKAIRHLRKLYKYFCD